MQTVQQDTVITTKSTITQWQMYTADAKQLRHVKVWVMNWAKYAN